MPTHRRAKDSTTKKKPQALVEAKAAEGGKRREKLIPVHYHYLHHLVCFSEISGQIHAYIAGNIVFLLINPWLCSSIIAARYTRLSSGIPFLRHTHTAGGLIPSRLAIAVGPPNISIIWESFINVD